MKHSKITVFLIIISGVLLGSCLNNNSSNNKEAEKKVLDILQKNEIISSADKPTITRSEIRELAKFGDRYYKLIKDGKKDNLKIVKIKHPHLISLLLDFPSLRTIGFRAKRDEFWPWEFVHMKIPDASFDPYGRSILEPMRAPFQQILINESLLALSRASKVERIVIRVPTTTKNPTSAFSSLMNARSILKNAIFGTSGSGKAKARVSGLTDILWLPSGQEYDIDKLQSSIDVTNIEDVEFFRDKFLTGTRLPKSFLLADDTDRLTEGVLSAQDLKFARALMPVQFGYTEGLTKLITMVLIVEGFDIEKISVEVSMRKPQAVMNSIIKNASESIGFVQEMIDSVARATGNEDGGVIGRKSWAKIMSTVTGLPVKFLNLFAKPEAPEVPVGTGTSDPEPPNNGGQEPEPPASDEEIVQSLLSDLLRSEITFTSKEILPSLGLTLDKAKGAQYDKRYEFLGESKKLYSVDKGKKNKYISRESREE